MPTYDYKCNSCDETYDVFHKVREVMEDVVCPHCGSVEHTRLISAPTVKRERTQDRRSETRCLHAQTPIAAAIPAG